MINSASDCYIILGIGDDFQPEVVGDFTEDHVASFLKVLRPSLQLSTADIAKRCFSSAFTFANRLLTVI